MTKVAVLSIGLLLALWAVWCIAIVFNGLPMPVVAVAVVVIGIMALFVAEIA